jgi:hypothetical protein
VGPVEPVDGGLAVQGPVENAAMMVASSWALGGVFHGSARIHGSPGLRGVEFTCGSWSPR